MLFDDYVVAIRDGRILSDVKFFMYERGANKRVIKKWYHGGWLMTDNGYLPWSVTVPPMKTTVDMAELRWSKWAESNRKDSECYFAIVKGRFRYLKAGIRGNRVEDADKVFMTCVAFHNWLLENDGLDKEWKSGKQGTWEGAEGTYQLPSNASRIFARLASPTDAQNRHLGFDVGGNGLGSNEQAAARAIPEHERIGLDVDGTSDWENRDGSCVVRKMPLGIFRSRLVEHFDIMYRARQVEWPVRNREPEWEESDFYPKESDVGSEM